MDPWAPRLFVCILHERRSFESRGLAVEVSAYRDDAGGFMFIDRRVFNREGSDVTGSHLPPNHAGVIILRDTTRAAAVHAASKHAADWFARFTAAGRKAAE